MIFLAVLALFCTVEGSLLQDYWNQQCRIEHGVCNRDQYENLRLIALRRSGCKRFCQCAHASTEIDGSVTYYWVAQICPAGTLFDDSLPAQVCNHEQYVKCKWADDGDACKQEHGTCNKYEYENIRLVALLSSGCQKFCQCVHASTELDGSVTYKWVEQTCPAGTLFDESLPTPVCNHANQVSCPVSSGSSTGPGTDIVDSTPRRSTPDDGCGGEQAASIAIVCEDSSIYVGCPDGKTLNIISAIYGRSEDDRVCPHPQIQTTSCSATTSTPIVTSACNGHQRCFVEASNRLYGDPCYLTYKYLEVVYTCQ